MKKVIQILVVLSYSTFASALIAQEIDKYNMIHESFNFRDGVYTNIDMVKDNSPIPSTWIETDFEVSDRDFYKNVTRKEEIIFFDDNGVRTSLNTKSIWGYAYNGDLYISVGGEFHKIDFVGRISHFVASKTTYIPVLYLDDSPDIEWIAPIQVTAKHNEYLVDIVDNKVWRFDLEGLERVLKNDPQLWSEFKTLNKREKEYQKYIFLNRYNKKYPLDIPFY